jgi:uncharacterized protein
MNRTFKAAVAALIVAVGFAGSAAAQPSTFSERFLFTPSSDRTPKPLNLGINAYQKGDYATALRLLRPLAERGNAEAQFYLGIMYTDGLGVQRDDAAAVSWYRKAADQGRADSQYNLGFIYSNGRGVPQDYAAAASWYRKAADRGLDVAQASLGFMYHNGLGVPQDYAAAATWARKAADQGNAIGQANLGSLYRDGRGVPKDYAAAMTWYRKAADQGNAKAQSDLGVMYADGRGTPQDYASAHMWFNLAAAKGQGDGTKYRDFVAAKMTPAQIAEAQKRAAQWHPKMANAPPMQATEGRVPLKMDGGTFVVPVQINGIMTLDFVIDSGAADVSVPADVVSTLIRSGTIKEPDFIGDNTYVLADGSTTKSPTFTIRTLKVGNTVLENVKGSVASAQGSLLLGQSFLNRFKSWSIDNTKQELLLEHR